MHHRQLRLPALALILSGLLGTVRPGVAQTVGDAAPDFTYTTLAGSEISLSDYRGQVVFIFFFGYACPFCLAVGDRTELEVNAVYSSRPDFQAIGLDLWNGAPSGVTAFKERTGVTYPLCLQAGSAATLFGTTYDRVMVVDRGGVIRYKGATAVSGTLDDAVLIIEELLATGSGLDDGVPSRFSLDQNYPNPFNPTTTITYSLTTRSHVSLRVFDRLGREIRTLMDATQSAGHHTASWDGTADSGRSVASGMYFYTLHSASSSQTRAMVLIR